MCDIELGFVDQMVRAETRKLGLDQKFKTQDSLS